MFHKDINKTKFSRGMRSHTQLQSPSPQNSYEKGRKEEFYNAAAWQTLFNQVIKVDISNRTN